MSTRIVDPRGDLSRLSKAVAIIAAIIAFLDVFIGVFFVWQGTLDIEYVALSLIIGIIMLLLVLVTVLFSMILQKKKTMPWLVATIVPTVILFFLTFLVLADIVSLGL